MNFKKEYTEKNIKKKIEKYKKDLKELDFFYDKKIYTIKCLIKSIFTFDNKLFTSANACLKEINLFIKYYKISIKEYLMFKTICYLRYRKKYSEKDLKGLVNKYENLQKKLILLGEKFD